ncbi:hypothetical protein [Leifsonia sp. NPDC058230]|uniref:hypothetical protein n=1 Tax=Leifsonia sp. NPDC058230 TaxID=3346391 RepID=UPI0036D8A80F
MYLASASWDRLPSWSDSPSWMVTTVPLAGAKMSRPKPTNRSAGSAPRSVRQSRTPAVRPRSSIATKSIA